MSHWKAITLACLLPMVAASTAGAAQITVDFGPLAGPNNTAYSGHTEDGFTVTPTAGSWFQGLAYGNPTPSIYAGPIGQPALSTVKVTSGSPFKLVSFDLSPNNGDARFSVVAASGGATIWAWEPPAVSNACTPPSYCFATYAAPGVPEWLDYLSITVNPGSGTTSINLDNIVLEQGTPVPEPTTMSLLALGLAGLVRARRGATRR